MGNLIASMKGFLQEPFKTPMSLPQYGMLVGVTIVLVILWNLVLAETVRGVREI